MAEEKQRCPRHNLPQPCEACIEEHKEHKKYWENHKNSEEHEWHERLKHGR
jgi:hypothetical protein